MLTMEEHDWIIHPKFSDLSIEQFDWIINQEITDLNIEHVWVINPKIYELSTEQRERTIDTYSVKSINRVKSLFLNFTELFRTVFF